jgi:deazaflavin-dependent oxidoreductase (nitroreductase family)
MNRPTRLVVRLAGRIHVHVFRLLGGHLVGRVGKAPILLLTTSGRRTGRPRTIPLLYVADGDTLAVVASFGGSPEHPQWYLNLCTDPLVTVEIGRKRRHLRASTASPEERVRLWPLFVASYAGYAAYQRRTSREIPVVVLRRLGRPEAPHGE